MFFILSKILDFILMPLSWILLGNLYGLFTKYEKRRKKALWFSVIVTFMAGNGYFANQLMTYWENPQNAPLNGTYDVAIILGGAIMNPNKMPIDSIYGHKEVDRMLQPVLLYKRGIVKKILYSGGKVEVAGVTGGQSEAPMLVKCMIQLGVKPEDIIVEGQSRNTHENAKFTAQILRKQFPNQRYLLFTSAFHIRRSLGCFQKEGIKVQTYRTNVLSAEPTFNLDKLLPNYKDFYLTSLLMREISGYWIYRLVGYC
jgi:uncharacterized SAM-binding protein YcdF (DUF218 family)